MQVFQGSPTLIIAPSPSRLSWFSQQCLKDVKGGSERHRELAKVTQEEGDGIRLEPRFLPPGMRPLVPIAPSL